MLEAECEDVAFEDASALFERRGDAIVTRREIVPTMMTTSAPIAHQDCLFYVAEDG